MKTLTGAFLVASILLVGRAATAEVITLRSGQISQGPGQPRQLDHRVRFLPNNPVQLPVSGNPFTAADFSGAAFGPRAVIIEPLSPPWITGLSDPQARWINWEIGREDPIDPLYDDNYGVPGSCLYSVIFNVLTPSIASATIGVEYAVDDTLGDWSGTGGNPEGFYVNGVSTGHHGGSFTAATTFNANITALITPGINYLYFYQRDLGASASGLIFSATIDIVAVPAPSAVAPVALLGALAGRRRRPRVA